MALNSSCASETDQPDLSLDMRDEDQRQLMAFLNCADCGHLADEALETLCCRTLVCTGCLHQRLDRVCPTCQRGCSAAPNHLARRLIGSQPWRCAHCGAESSRSEAAEHSRLCPRQRRNCPAVGCQFAGLADAFLDHLVAEHSAQLLRRAGRLFGRAGEAPTSASSATAAPAAAAVLGDSVRMVGMGVVARHGPLRRLQYYNAGPGRGDPSRTFADVTGKNYCGGQLNGAPCECCDGRCGPSNGCNCIDCMRRDLVTFRVDSSQPALINREGVIARMSPETGKFYCGRPNMGHDSQTDGFCGPNNGNNCHSCRQLDRQARDRYASIVSNWA